MSLKDLLVLVDATPSSAHRIKVAFDLAIAFDAHVAALCLVVEPYVPAVAGMHLPPQIVDEQRARALAESAALLQELAHQAAAAGVKLETRSELAQGDRLADVLARQCRHVDLAIVGQPDAERGDDNDRILAEAAFMNSGRPAIVVPFIGARKMPPQKVAIAWDGSREAARAVNDALPLLLGAKEVAVLVVAPERLGGRVGATPGADIAAHLARHGVKVEVKTMPAARISIGDAILAAIADESSDLLVMGGYGHSRLREMILGGTTEHLLRHMTIPIMLAH